MSTTLPPAPVATVVRIGSKRAGIDRVWGSVLAVTAVFVALLLTGVAVLAAAVDDAGVVWVLLPVLPFLMFSIGFSTFMWGSLRAIDVPVELGPEGAAFRIAQGVVRCPLDAVASVHHGRYGRTDTIVIRLHPQAGPGAPGVESTVSTRAWKTIHAHGLRYATWLLDVEPAQLDRALADATGGRLRLLPKP